MCDKKNERLTKRDLYERYWKCRDFEIQNLWQRAIFLGPILVLTFTGYGAFFAKCFIVGNEVKLLESGFSESHLVAVAIALMGILFSILWIRMMKGSKAWYEVYERAITALDTQKDWIFDRELLECGAGFKHHRLPGYKLVNKIDKPQFCDSLFSTKGGCYSPSKINIVIGQISLVIWFFVAAVHLISCFGAFANDWCAVMVVFIEIMVILVVLLTVFKSQCALFVSKCSSLNSIKFFECRSSSLKDYDPGVYSKDKTDKKRIYTLRIVDFEGKIESLLNASRNCSTGITLPARKTIESVSLDVILDKDFEHWVKCPCYASFNFESWCERKKITPSNEAAEKFFKEEIKPVYDNFRKSILQSVDLV